VSDKDPTISAREMRYRAAQAKRDRVRVTVWVPKARADELKSIAAKMREGLR